MCQIYPLVMRFLKYLRSDLKSAHENLEWIVIFLIVLILIMTRPILNPSLFFRSA